MVERSMGLQKKTIRDVTKISRYWIATTIDFSYIMKKTIIIGFLALLVIAASLTYYYYPRKVKFKLVYSLDKPDYATYPDYDLYSFKGFHKAEDADELKYWLLEYPKKEGYPECSFDSLSVERIANELDFEKYDYLITYQKKLLELRHSPHLRKAKDGLYFDKRIPLICTWDTTRTEAAYIYRIRSNKHFRTIGP